MKGSWESSGDLEIGLLSDLGMMSSCNYMMSDLGMVISDFLIGCLISRTLTRSTLREVGGFFHPLFWSCDLGC